MQGGTSGLHLPPNMALAYGPGNLEIDLLFVDIDGPDNNLLTILDNDYRIALGSPCCDAGDNALVAFDVSTPVRRRTCFGPSASSPTT